MPGIQNLSIIAPNGLTLCTYLLTCFVRQVLSLLPFGEILSCYNFVYSFQLLAEIGGIYCIILYLLYYI